MEKKKGTWGMVCSTSGCKEIRIAPDNVKIQTFEEIVLEELKDIKKRLDKLEARPDGKYAQ